MKITREQYDQACTARREADALINAYLVQQDEEADARIETGVPFTDDELVYAARTLCPCGHGLAYPKNCGTLHQHWDCSAILKGIADKTVKHTPQLPFAMYEIKSEQQPSAGGATTRGVFHPKPAEG